MVEPQSMQDLMFNDGLIVASLANGKVLSYVSVANLRPAPLKRRKKFSSREFLSSCNSQDSKTQIRLGLKKFRFDFKKKLLIAFSST